MRDRKQKTINELKALREQLRSIHTKLPESRRKQAPSNLPEALSDEEAPERRFVVTEALLARYRRYLTEKEQFTLKAEQPPASLFAQIVYGPASGASGPSGTTVAPTQAAQAQLTVCICYSL